MSPDVAAAIARATSNVTQLRPRDRSAPGTDLELFTSPAAPGTEIELRADVIDLRPERSRIEIVPLISQATDLVPVPQQLGAPVIDLTDDRDADVIDLRESKGHRERQGATTHNCSACSANGHMDMIDNVNGILHLSCPNCFRMWSEQVRREPAPTDN